MKPTFALDLSRDLIALLHRTPKGWLTIGEVAFDAPDMAEELDFLRKTALGLSPLGLASKVILPNAQILYTEVHAPGPSREDKRRQIAQALQGRTPYPVEDLVFDWSGKGTVVRVAVVARETLDEAESFAVSHRLNPVSFVAIPEDGTFVGEAWFGPTNTADTFLAPGETVERDREAVSILPLLPASAQAAEPVDSLPGLEEALSADVTEADLAAVSAGRVDAPPEESFDTVEPLFDDPIDGPVDGPDLLDLVPEATIDIEPGADEAPLPPEVTLAVDEVETPPEPEPEPEPEPSFAPEVANDMPQVPAPVTSEAEEAPFADVPDEAEPTETTVPKVLNGEARVLDPDILDDDLPPAPSPAALFAFSSRRSANPGTKSETPGRVMPPVTSDRPTPPMPRVEIPTDAMASPVAARPFSAAVTAPSIPGTRPKPKLKPTMGEIPRPVSPGPVTVKPLTRPHGTFGSPPPKQRRTGFVFMVLIGLLLLSLALVAAWASFFLTQAANDAGASDPVEVVEVPAVEDEMAADLQDPEEFAAAEGADPAVVEGPATDLTDADAADLEALAVEEMPVNLGGDDSGVQPVESVAATLDETALPGDPAAGTEAETAGAEAGTGEAAPGTTIATDVSGSRTPVEDQDEIFLAAMDAPPPILDALALPTPPATTDAPPAAPMLPPAPGTVYQFDAQGLLVPTPEGILSPEGVMLFAGKPPLVPPTRSAAAETAAAAAAPVAAPASDPATAADASLVTAGETGVAVPEGTAEAPITVVPSDPAMAGFRPKPRPEALVVPDDGASLDAGTGVEVATLRPLPRPSSVTAAAAAANPDSAVADLGAQGASLAAQAEASLAEAEALEAANPSIVAISMRPAARPSDLSRAVEAAVAAAVREPEPVAEAEVELAAANTSSDEHAEIDEPETDGAAPAIPTKASVAKQATYDNAINLSKINLIGTFGTSSKPYALIRQANGKYKKVKIGDKIDGGVVKAITENEVRYQKGGKLVTLKMPKA